VHTDFKKLKGILVDGAEQFRVMCSRVHTVTDSDNEKARTHAVRQCATVCTEFTLFLSIKYVP